MGSKLIFLDFDGVLNSAAFFKRAPLPLERLPADDEILRHFDGTTCARLERIIAATDAKLVFSSSWRAIIEVGEARRILVRMGAASADFVGKTPTLLRAVEGGDFSRRGAEVQEWLNEESAAPEPSDYVILDDAHVGARLYPRQVQTANETGLLDQHVEQAIALLSER